jgi:hypothetical protein
MQSLKNEEIHNRPTKRAPDVWDSAAFSRLFSGFEFFLLPSRVHARPHASIPLGYASGTMTQTVSHTTQEVYKYGIGAD